MTRWRRSRAFCGRVSRARSTTSATGFRSAAASWPRRFWTPVASLPRSSGSPARARAGRTRSIRDGCGRLVGTRWSDSRTGSALRWIGTGATKPGGACAIPRRSLSRLRGRVGWGKKRRAPRRAPLANVESGLGGANVIRPRSLLALLDVEADGLATTQAVEVQGGVDATLMEEVLLAIIGGEDPKSAVGHAFLYVAFWHCPSSPSRTPN